MNDVEIPVKPITINDEQTVVLTRATEELRLLFEKAERYIKKAERINSEVVVPAINELRYAGHHSIVYVNSHFNEKFDNLERAKRHCKRAIYDAVEASITFYLSGIKDFERDFKSVEISSIVKDYLDMKQSYREISNRIIPTHGDEEKLQLFEIVQADISKLETIYHKLEDARDELNKKLKKERTNFFLVLAGILIPTIVGVAGTIIYN